MHSFRFGLLNMSPVTHGADWIELIQSWESDGYDTVLFSDHFERSPVAPIPALMAAAMATTTLRIGSAVLANDFRQPAILAKELATIDLLSGGRLEVGLGAGWMLEDYEQSGIPMDPAPRRIDRMVETLDLLDEALRNEITSSSGPAYNLDGLVPLPVTVQRPRPPLLIGGGGRRILQIAARRADIVSMNWNLRNGRFDATALPTGNEASTDQQVEWVRSAAGSRLDEIELHLQVYLAEVTDDPVRAASRWCAGLGFDIDVDAVVASPHVLLGSVDQIVDKLERQRERWGFSYVSFYDSAAEAMLPVVHTLTQDRRQADRS